MDPEPKSLIADLLDQMQAGNPVAEEQLIVCLYDDMRRMAAAMIRAEKPGHTLQATALVHEAYVRLFSGKPPSANNRQHFLALTGQVMRRLLVDHARKKQSQKRGSGQADPDADLQIIAADVRPEQVLEVDLALRKLELYSARTARIIEWKYFVGLDLDEIAGLLGVTARTIQRELRMGRSFLASVLGAEINTVKEES